MNVQNKTPSPSGGTGGAPDGQPRVRRASIVGAGLIGRSWAIVFARAGIDTTLYDPVVTTGRAAIDHIRASLDELARHGLVSNPVEAFDRITLKDRLAEAVADADWVQECAPENLESKRRLFSVLDGSARPEAILASSTSGFRASSFTEHLEGRARALVAHPVNPPHLAPLVEIAPSPWTDRAVAERALTFMNLIGQKAILVRKEIDGFVLNRLQGAVLDEAFKLVEDGYVSVEDLDRAMVFGLAPRWYFMGPFETIDLNAPGGVRDYAERYGPMYHRFASDRSPDARAWGSGAVAAVEAGRRRALPMEALEDRANWRDRIMMKLAAHRARLGNEGDPL